MLPVEHWRLFGLSCSEFLFSVQPVWRCVAFHVRRGRGPKLAIHSVGGLSRREILKISAALAGSGVFLSSDSPGAAQPGGRLTSVLLCGLLFGRDRRFLEHRRQLSRRQVSEVLRHGGKERMCSMPLPDGQRRVRSCSLRHRNAIGASAASLLSQATAPHFSPVRCPWSEIGLASARMSSPIWPAKARCRGG